MPTLSSRRMTLGEMRGHVYFLSDIKPSAVFPIADINRLINVGLAAVGDQVGYEDTVATTAADPAILEYPLIDPVLVSGLPVVSSVTQLGAALTFSTTPVGILLASAPTDDDISVSYKMEPRPLIADTDTAPLSPDAIECACLYAVYQMKLKDDEYGAADRWKARYDEKYRVISMPHTGVYKGL